MRAVASLTSMLDMSDDLDAFAKKVMKLLRPRGLALIADAHPYRKTVPFENGGMIGDYFSDEIIESPVAYEDQFPAEERATFPKCKLRLWTMGEIVTAFAAAGMRIEQLVERPDESGRLPGSFVLTASPAVDVMAD